MNRRCLIDFLDPRLSANCEISSDGVSDDYYTLENLISTDTRKRKLGFMTFSVSKPPIEIIIKFKWNINMKILKVYSMLSSLKSTKFQVFVQCSNSDGNEVFRKIGDVGLDEDKQGFCLVAENSVENTDETLMTYSIFPSTKKSIQSTKVIKIVILGTRMGRAPVLKKLELWGRLSTEASPGEVQEVQKLWMESETMISKQIGDQEQSLKCTDSEAILFHIPEEFVDSITQEVLVMPYILPSGNVIDESTLEKFNKHEETYGRLPSDPFTGLTYTKDNQPKFNEALKTRLDEFKLQNSHEIEIKQSGRTIGKKNETGPSKSNYSTNGHVSKKIKLSKSPSRDLNTLISSIYQNKQISIFTRPRDLNTKNGQSMCTKCCSTTSLDIYRIDPCNHIFCRACLLILNASCGACKASFQPSNVTKINF